MPPSVFPSFRRKPESRRVVHAVTAWTPAFAGVTDGWGEGSAVWAPSLFRRGPESRGLVHVATAWTPAFAGVTDGLGEGEVWCGRLRHSGAGRNPVNVAPRSPHRAQTFVGMGAG